MAESLTIKERAKNLFGNKTSADTSKTTVLPDKGNTEVAAAVAESKEKLQRTKTNRPSGIGGATTQAGTPKTPEQIGAELSALLQPEVWEPVVKAPANLMMALTNHAHWDISDKEAKPLAVTASSAMQYAAIRSPGLLALSLFLIHATIVYGPRTIMELKIRKDEKIIAERKKAGMGEKPPEKNGS